MSVHKYNKKYDYKNIKTDDSIIGDNSDTPLTIRLQTPTIPYTNLVICDNTYNEEKREEYKREDYNIFTGSKVNITTEKTVKEINAAMKELCNVLLQFMKAGYHLYSESEKNASIYNSSKIEDWIINFEYPMLKMFKNYFDIRTSCEDILFADEFLDNPQFRYMITDILMKIMSNYGLNNLEINGDWYKINVYQQIYDKL